MKTKIVQFKLQSTPKRRFRAEAHQSNYYERSDWPSYEQTKRRTRRRRRREKKPYIRNTKSLEPEQHVRKMKNSPFGLTQKTNQVCNKTTQYFFDDNIYVWNAKQPIIIIKYIEKKLENHIYFSGSLVFGWSCLCQHLPDCRQNHANNVKLHMISIKPKGFFHWFVFCFFFAEWIHWWGTLQKTKETGWLETKVPIFLAYVNQ